MVVPGDEHLAAMTLGEVDDPGQVVHRHHRALIDHKQRPRRDGLALVDHAQELRGVVAPLDPSGSEHVPGGLGAGQANRLAAVGFPCFGACGDGVRLAGPGWADADRDAARRCQVFIDHGGLVQAQAGLRQLGCVLRPCAQLRVQGVCGCAGLRGAELARKRGCASALRLLAHALLHSELPAGGVPGDAGPGVDTAPIQFPGQRPRHGRPFGRF